MNWSNNSWSVCDFERWQKSDTSYENRMSLSSMKADIHNVQWTVFFLKIAKEFSSLLLSCQFNHSLNIKVAAVAFR